MTDKKDLMEMMRSAVAEALSEREGASREAKIAEVLETAEETITDLNAVIQEKEALLAQASADQEELKTRVAEVLANLEQLKQKLADAEAEKQGVELRAREAEASLAEIAKDRALELRMAELATAKVAKTGEKLEAQKLRVKEMSDEEFAAYKAELEDMRSVLEAELKAAASVEEVAGANIEVAPADIDKARLESAAAAGAINIELGSGEGVAEKYSKFAKTLAEKFKKESR